VFELLELEPAEYRQAGLTLQEITGFRTGVFRGALVETRYPRVVSYAIRRCEFDTFLLRRAGVRVCEETPVASLRSNGGTWIVDDRFEAPVVIGAGGHFCPVAARLRGGADTSSPIVAKETEFRLDAQAAAAVSVMPELFFCRDLEGYAWCVRKGDYLNVGIGRRAGRDFNEHVRQFVGFLEETGVLKGSPAARWRGHAYFAAGAGTRPLVGDGMLVVGDAAGLAYPESGEGIAPAIESGRLAAEMLIAAGGRYRRQDLAPYAEQLRALHPRPWSSPAPLRGAVAALGRRLLASPAFTRKVVLDRWFLRATA
jgi:flavin-dependent dehydrogenase